MTNESVQNARIFSNVDHAEWLGGISGLASADRGYFVPMPTKWESFGRAERFAYCAAFVRDYYFGV